MRFSLIAFFLLVPIACTGIPKPAAQPTAPPAAPASVSPLAPLPSSNIDSLTPTRRARAAPAPLTAKGHAVDWWFAFKFNAATFPGCADSKSCPFGGDPQTYRSGESETFALSSSDSPQLTMQAKCVGESDEDPVGATFAQVYNGSFFYVLWNDQFYQDPKIVGCSNSCAAPWAHSKGMVAWGPSGDGFVMQVSTPSWPAAGSASHPRGSDGNTLGCVKDDNVMVSQHFFALKLSHEDLIGVLAGLANASVVTDIGNQQIVSNGGPDDIQSLVNQLGVKSDSISVVKTNLSTGVTLISKPSGLHVPPWQMVSSVLGGVSLRTATWWESNNPIPTTRASTRIQCWDANLGRPGAVEIATTGTWEDRSFALTGGLGRNHNHAKLGITTDQSPKTVIFGDMNQEGALSGNCSVSQNGRGGLFFAVNDPTLHSSVTSLLSGDTAH